MKKPRREIKVEQQNHISPFSVTMETAGEVSLYRGMMYGRIVSIARLMLRWTKFLVEDA